MIAMGIVLACSTLGAASFGAGNEVYDGSYRTPPSLYAHVSQSVSHIELAATVQNTSVDFPSGGVEVIVRLFGPPDTDLDFLLLGNDYFARSDFRSSQGGVSRYEGGAFVPGVLTAGGCRPQEEVVPSSWMDSESEYSAIRGKVRSGADGTAVATITFEDSADWYVLYGDKAAVHLPRLYVDQAWTSDCQVGLGGYVGSWAKPTSASAKMALAYRADSRDIRITSLFPADFDSGQDGLADLSPPDLEWSETRSEGTDTLFVLASYVVQSPRTEARAQSLLFGSALAFGLALAALLQLVTSWPKSTTPGRTQDALSSHSQALMEIRENQTSVPRRTKALVVATVLTGAVLALISRARR